MKVHHSIEAYTINDFPRTVKRIFTFLSLFLFLVYANHAVAQCQPGDPDTDGDGICDAYDICPYSPLNQDIDNDQICDAEVCDLANFENFEVGYWIWNAKHISYSRILSTPYAISGDYALKLSSNDPISYFDSDKLDWSSLNEVVLTLNFQTISYSAGQHFNVQISSNNGSTYDEVIQYSFGIDIPANATIIQKRIYLAGPFTDQMRLKVQAFGTGSIYYDDLSLEYCLSCDGLGDPNGNGHCDCYSAEDDDLDGICNGEDTCPDLDNSMLGTVCDDGNPCTVNDVWRNNCQCEGDVLPDRDNDGICDAVDSCPETVNDLDIDKDGIADCSDTCIDVNENGICDNIDSAPFTGPLKLYFSKNRGFIDGTTTLDLMTSDPNATILYADTWGTEWLFNDFQPIASIYNGPITISNHTQIRAIAFTATDTTELQSHTYLDLTQYTPDERQVYMQYPVMELSHVSDGNRSVDELTIMEVFWPDGRFPGTSAPAGIRNRKWGVDQAGMFRLYFRGEYGAAKLDYDLFPEVEYGCQSSASHDKVNLHGGSQDGFGSIWHGYGTLMRDRFFQHLQLESNGNGVRGQYYLMMWQGNLVGIKNAEEVPQQGYMEEYFGNGEKEDYGVQTYYSDELLPGNAYETITTKEEFYDAIDVTNFIDYCLVQWLAGNHDWGLNNVDVAGLIDGPYYHWAFDMHASDPGTEWMWGTYVYTTTVPGNDIDFRMDFADRIYLHFIEGGPFTQDKLTRAYMELKHSLTPMVGFVTNDYIWENAAMDLYYNVHKNSPKLLAWLQNNGFFPSLQPVGYNLTEGLISPGSNMILSNPNSTGEIYYSINGIDPRLQGGAIDPAALLYSGPIQLPNGTVQVIARVKNGTEWSAAKQMIFQVGQNNGLVINEIHFNPADSDTTGNVYEFVELKNAGSTAIDLEYFRLEGGIRFKFDYNRSPLLQPEEFVVIARDRERFNERYGFYPHAEYKDKLGNADDLIYLKDTRFNIVDSVHYYDVWANKDGDSGIGSLALISTSLDNALADSWSIQSTPVTPGAENVFDFIHDDTGIVINEIHYHPVDSLDANGSIVIYDDQYEYIEIKNCNNSAVDLSGSFFSRGIIYSFPTGSILSPNQIIILARDSIRFTERYQVAAFGQYAGKLDNGGEAIHLHAQDSTLLDAVIYDDVAPWPLEADGSPTDYSLALISCDLDNYLVSSWCLQNTGVSPGIENNFPDADNDGVSDCIDVCPGGLDIDEDHDGVCDSMDQCLGFDDNIDLDGNGIPDGCENCRNHLNENNRPSIVESQFVNENIGTNGSVSENQIIFYKAGFSILLKDDFQVEVGATFHAIIEDCH